MATYRIIATNTASFRPRAEVPFSSVTFSDVLNRPGSCTIEIPLQADVDMRQFTRPGNTAIWIERNGDIVWGGPLWTTDVDLVGQSVRLSCEGWLSYYNHRINTINFDTGTFIPGEAGQDIATVMYQVLRTTKETFDETPNWGLTYPTTQGVPPIDIDPWLVAAFSGGLGWDCIGAVRASELLNMGTFIERLLNGEYSNETYNAYGVHTADYAIVPSWDYDSAAPKAEWAFWNYKRGASIAKPLALDAGIVSLGVTYDATNQANEVYVLGTGGGDLAPRASATRGRSQNALHMQVAISRDLDNQASTQSFATDAVRALREPHIIPEVSIRGDNPEWDWTTYSVGDTFTLDVEYSFVDLRIPWRIMEKETSVDSSGTETVKISVADDELFQP